MRRKKINQLDELLGFKLHLGKGAACPTSCYCGGCEHGCGHCSLRPSALTHLESQKCNPRTHIVVIWCSKRVLEGIGASESR